MTQQRPPATLLQRPEPVDIFRCLADLNYAGYSTVMIAFALGCAETTVRGWKQGSAPRFEDGRALILFYELVLGRTPPTTSTHQKPKLVLTK